ncbi:hypothetical protein KBA41_12140 [Candidatus Ozemobacteraceae bacterium]|nr:hypothetical protein [Candidatus Ozemobacteraceae bacterium]
MEGIRFTKVATVSAVLITWRGTVGFEARASLVSNSLTLGEAVHEMPIEDTVVV